MALALLCSPAMAQSDVSTDFVPDRPGVSTPPDVVTFRKVQMEDGFQYENTRGAGICSQNFLFSSLLVRYGFVRGAELRMAADFAYNVVTDSSGPSVVSGFDAITISSKIKLIEQKKAIPNISLMFDLTLPYIGNKKLRPDNFAPSFYLLMSNNLTDKLNLCYNYGMTWDGSSPIPTHFYAASLALALAPEWSVYLEGYGYSALHTASAFYMDTGVAFLINNHLQLDFSITGSINSIRDYYMLNAGIAWKIPGKP
ncbi:MAG: transporter [Bacteroidales bacterium]|nr:transporter [Bacteroidales bacterium]